MIKDFTTYVNESLVNDISKLAKKIYNKHISSQETDTDYVTLVINLRDEADKYNLSINSLYENGASFIWSTSPSDLSHSNFIKYSDFPNYFTDDNIRIINNKLQNLLLNK